MASHGRFALNKIKWKEVERKVHLHILNEIETVFN